MIIGSDSTGWQTSRVSQTASFAKISFTTRAGSTLVRRNPNLWCLKANRVVLDTKRVPDDGIQDADVDDVREDAVAEVVSFTVHRPPWNFEPSVANHLHRLSE